MQGMGRGASSVAILLAILSFLCLDVVDAFLLSLKDRALSVRATLSPSSSSHAATAYRRVLLHMSDSSSSSSEEKNKRSRRRGRRKRDDSSSAGTLASSGSARYDPTLDDLIEDERKTTLPRLEDLKRGKKTDLSSTEGTTGQKILLPREIEEIKRKERLEAEGKNKGAPGYVGTMTKVTWAAIAILVITEVIVQLPLVHK